jgi:hypothetical protein
VIVGRDDVGGRRGRTSTDDVNLTWATAIVLAASAASVGVLLLIRRWSPHGGHFGDTSRASGVFTILATFFAVLFAFVVLFAFTNYSNSAASAELEAQVVLQQFETAQLLPAADTSQLGAQLRCYARSVIHQEWPQMQRGESLPINEWDGELFATLEQVEPVTAVEQAAFAKWLDQRSEREQARQERELGEEGVIPAPLWFILALSAVIVWAFAFLFADRAEGALVQGALVGAVTAMLVAGLLVVRFLDHPYNPGSGSLQPDAMRESLQHIDETSERLEIELPTLCADDGRPA